MYPGAPVGEAFRLSLRSNPGVILHQGDGSHPTREGSYLAAAVIPATITAYTVTG